MPLRAAAKADAMEDLLSREPLMLTERTVGGTLFSFRWLLAPFYLDLARSLLVLLIKFGQKTA